MDFIGFTMADHYRAVAAERERQVAASRWRRKLDEARRENAVACCAAYERGILQGIRTETRPATGV